MSTMKIIIIFNLFDIAFIKIDVPYIKTKYVGCNAY